MKGLEDVTYPLTYQNVIEILRIIDDTPDGHELSLQIGDFTLTVKKEARRGQREPETASPSAVAAGAPAVSRPSSRAPTAPPPVSPDAVTVTAPMVGTFYRAPAPGAAPFVDVGTDVEPDTIVGIIEVMKLMNEIRAGHRGRVVAVLTENGAVVEYGQPLVVIEPRA